MEIIGSILIKSLKIQFLEDFETNDVKTFSECDAIIASSRNK